MMHLNAVLGVESKGLLVDVDDEHLPCVASREDVWCRMCMYRMCVRACARARARARACVCVRVRACVWWVGGWVGGVLGGGGGRRAAGRRAAGRCHLRGAQIVRAWGVAQGGEEEVRHEDAHVESGGAVEGKLGVDHLKGVCGERGEGCSEGVGWGVRGCRKGL